jgi:hypothetical protein
MQNATSPVGLSNTLIDTDFVIGGGNKITQANGVYP